VIVLFRETQGPDRPMVEQIDGDCGRGQGPEHPGEQQAGRRSQWSRSAQREKLGEFRRHGGALQCLIGADPGSQIPDCWATVGFVQSFRRLRTSPRIFGLVAAGVFSTFVAVFFVRPAQAADPVSASAQIAPAPLAEGNVSEVTVDVAVERGWHVMTYPQPTYRKLKLAGDKRLALFEGEFSIQARISAEDPSARPEGVVVNFRYQACNATVCLRPATLTLSVDAAERDARSDAGNDPATVRAVGGKAAPSHGGLVWTGFTSEAYIAAVKADRPFVMGFSAEWCLPCREMYERTYTDQRVIEAGEGVGFLEVDSTESSDFIARVMESFDVKGLPTTLFFDSGGQEHTRRGGFISASEFARLLDDTKKAARLLDDTKKAAPPMPTTSPSAI